MTDTKAAGTYHTGGVCLDGEGEYRLKERDPSGRSVRMFGDQLLSMRIKVEDYTFQKLLWGPSCSLNSLCQSWVNIALLLSLAAAACVFKCNSDLQRATCGPRLYAGYTC